MEWRRLRVTGLGVETEKGGEKGEEEGERESDIRRKSSRRPDTAGGGRRAVLCAASPRCHWLKLH
jgi:hypothetical protein